MKTRYLVYDYREGCEPSEPDQCKTLAEAREIAKEKISMNDLDLGRKMEPLTYPVEHQLDGWTLVETWTAQGEDGDNNEDDYVNIYRSVE